MLKKMILAGLLAASAAPALASDASYDNKASATQASPGAAAKTDSAPAPACACACQKHHA